MAVLKGRHYRIPGSDGAAKGYQCVATLVAGAVTINHGFHVIESCSVTIINEEDAEAAQTFTLTGLTINSNGFPKVTDSNGQSVLKSSEGASVVSVLVDIKGY